MSEKKNIHTNEKNMPRRHDVVFVKTNPNGHDYQDFFMVCYFHINGTRKDQLLLAKTFNPSKIEP